MLILFMAMIAMAEEPSKEARGYLAARQSPDVFTESVTAIDKRDALRGLLAGREVYKCYPVELSGSLAIVKKKVQK